jgi:hypothetical protein
VQDLAAGWVAAPEPAAGLALEPAAGLELGLAAVQALDPTAVSEAAQEPAGLQRAADWEKAIR